VFVNKEIFMIIQEESMCNLKSSVPVDLHMSVESCAQRDLGTNFFGHFLTLFFSNLMPTCGIICSYIEIVVNLIWK
jgi:hypothetical protein